MTTSPSKRSLENELALLIFHMKMNRMTPHERAVYFNTLLHKREHFKW